MHAIINNKLCILSDHSPQPGRLLIEVRQSARKVETTKLFYFFKYFFNLTRQQLSKVPVILVYDGLNILSKKAIHMARRERQESGGHCASFSGTVIDDKAESEANLIGKRVAGISVTHPADTGFVIARPEFVFPIHEELDESLAAFVLYGGMAVYAATTAMRLTDGPIGVSGYGMLAYAVASILVHEGRQVALCVENRPIDFESMCSILNVARKNHDTPRKPAEASIWIETDDSGMLKQYVIKQVIGISTSINTLRKLWPNSQQHSTAHVGDVVTRPDKTTDLYYYDGDVDWPDWCQPCYFRHYLDLASVGKISLGRPARKLQLDDFSSHSTSKIRKMLSDLKLAGSEVVFTEFGTTSPSISPKPLTIRYSAKTASRPHATTIKKISLVGAGRWPLGMVVRQIIRNKRIVLRGVCDRRPEVLHLAAQALPFAYTTTNFDYLLNDKETDMIVVATYHATHASFAAQALSANKHCYVEKPPAVNKKQLEAIYDVAQKTDRMLYVGYNRRFAPATRILMQHLQEIEGPVSIGMVIRPIDIGSYKQWILWPSNGGSRIISNICHMTDFALHLAQNARPISIVATPSEEGRSDMNLMITMTFENGSMASILFTDRGSGKKGLYDEFYHVMKGDLNAKIDNFTNLAISRGNKKIATWRGAVDKGHRGQMAVVANALLQNDPSPVPLAVTMTSAHMYLAVVESVALGEPVHLDVSKLLPSVSGQNF